MASFTIDEICRAAKGTVVHAGTAKRCTGVSTDTRHIEKGALFIALKGERFDGHAFLEKAAAGGASAVLVSSLEETGALPPDVSVIQTADTLTAMEDLAHFHRCRFSIPVVAVTGSNGKTTTKNMIAALLETRYQVRKTEKNHNNEIGLSQTLLALTPSDQVCVVEMGMRGLGQIARLAEIAAPTVGVVTNVSATHIGILGSMENIARAKSELISALGPEGTAVLNEDDPYVKAMVSCTPGRVIGYGIGGNHTVQAVKIHYDPDRTQFVCSCFDEVFHVSLPLLGVHNVYNALAAAGAARVLGVQVSGIQKALAEFKPEEQRQQVIHMDGISILDDSYNANPLSMDMAFRAMKQMKAVRRILVLGDMMELGKYEKELHYETGEKAASYGFDGLIAVGKASRNTAQGAREKGMKNVWECMSCEEAALLLEEKTRPGDLILIKGSHSMQMETIPDIWRRNREDHGHQLA